MDNEERRIKLLELERDNCKLGLLIFYPLFFFLLIHFIKKFGGNSYTLFIFIFIFSILLLWIGGNLYKNSKELKKIFKSKKNEKRGK